MNREDRIAPLVMRAIADDYEDMEMVVFEVSRWADEEGLAVSPAEISACLTRLIEQGMAAAYLLRPTAEPPKPVQYLPQSDVAKQYTFLLTDRGIRALTEAEGGA
jgi:hypothetical protein